MPRVIVPGQIHEDKVMIDLRPEFNQYPKEKFEHIQGSATGLAVAGKTVTVDLVDGTKRDVNYDVLVIATGSVTKDDAPWKIMGTTENTKANLLRLREEITNAKTIVVAGGGLTGTETAGELGYEYAQNGKKEVYFIHSDILPLGAPLKDSVRQQARTELERLKVKIVNNAKVTNVTKTEGSDTVIEVTKADGKTETITAQAYISAIGLKPNTEFISADNLDDRKRIKTTSTLQLEGHPEVFVIGDAGFSQTAVAQHADSQSKYLVGALPIYLKGGKLPVYAKKNEAYGITLGRAKATGQLGGFKAFSFMIMMFKGKTMFVEAVPGWAKGKKTLATTYEK